MRLHPTGRVLGWFLGFTFIGAGIGLHAGEPPSDQALAKRGLKRAGPLLVLEAESEVHAKAQDVADLTRQLSRAVAQQRATVSETEYQNTIKSLTTQLNQLKAQSNAVNQNINRLPRARRGRYFVNNYVAEEYQELNFYKQQLQMEIQQGTAYLNQLKSKPFDPRARIKADAEVRDRQEAQHQAAQELRKLIDGALAKYAGLEKDPQVKTWLNTPEGSAGIKPKLGPSRAFVLEEKALERIERQSPADEPATPAPKATRKGRRTSRSKRAAGAGNTASPF